MKQVGESSLQSTCLWKGTLGYQTGLLVWVLKLRTIAATVLKCMELQSDIFKHSRHLSNKNRYVLPNYPIHMLVPRSACTVRSVWNPAAAEMQKHAVQTATAGGVAFQCFLVDPFTNI